MTNTHHTHAPTPRRAERRTCGKYFYATEEMAENHLKRQQSKPFRGFAPKRVYACPRCRGFHLTSKVGHEEFAATLMAKKATFYPLYTPYLYPQQ